MRGGRHCVCPGFVRAGQGVGEGAADAGSGEDDHRAGGQQERSRGRQEDQGRRGSGLRRGERRPLHGNLGQDRPERERNLRVHRYTPLSLSLFLSASHLLARTHSLIVAMSLPHSKHASQEASQGARSPRTRSLLSLLMSFVDLGVVVDGVGLTQTVVIVALQDSGFVVKEDPKPIKKGGCCS